LSKNEKDSFLSDEELVHRYKNSHDNAYIGELYIRYTHLVYGVCLKYLQNSADAEDAVMQIFEKLIKELKKHHVDVFKPWLYTVARNHCMMAFRKEAVATKHTAIIQKTTLDSVESTPDEHLADEADRVQMVSYLQQGMDHLKDEQRRCVELFYLWNKSYKQIADQTGYSLNEVKSYIQNGKRNLKAYIEQQNNG
jgi:RNA polymerase sigma factor (sigma-70 family)